MSQINFIKNGGTGGDDSITVAQGNNMPSIIPPTKEGSQFIGYYMQNTHIETIINEEDISGDYGHLWSSSTQASCTTPILELDSWSIKIYSTSLEFQDDSQVEDGNISVSYSNDRKTIYITYDVHYNADWHDYTCEFTLNLEVETNNTYNNKYYSALGTPLKEWPYNDNLTYTLYAKWEFQGMHIYSNNQWKEAVPYIWTSNIHYSQTPSSIGNNIYHIEEIIGSNYALIDQGFQGVYNGKPYITESSNNLHSHLSDFDILCENGGNNSYRLTPLVLVGAKFSQGIYDFNLCWQWTNGVINSIPFQIISNANAWEQVRPYTYSTVTNSWGPEYYSP